MPVVDKVYMDNTLFSTEVYSSRKRKRSQTIVQGNYGAGATRAGWTCARTISEMNALSPSVAAQFIEAATLNDEEVLETTFKEAL